MDAAIDRLCGQNVSRETIARFETFEALLRKWNSSINLVSRNSLDALWTRHIADSVQVYRSAGPFRTWLDIGSGGGLPGAIVAIIAMDENPEAQVTLMESDKRKAAFLRTVSRETGSGFIVKAERIEEAPPERADVISARAVANLSTLLEFADRHLLPDGQAIFPKGVSWQSEVDAARTEWAMDLTSIPSLTEPGSVILKIKGISRV